VKQAVPDATGTSADLPGKTAQIDWNRTPFASLDVAHRPTRHNDPGHRELALYHLRFPAPESPVLALESALAPDEKARLAPMAPARRLEFTMLRALLRIVLGDLMGLPADHVPLQIDASGKPVVPGDSGPWFNLSHTQHQGLCAIDLRGPVGVDLELTTRQPRTSMEAIAARILSPEALTAIEGAEGSDRAAVFLRQWVRNEAAGKALGTGLRRGGSLDATLEIHDLTDIPGCVAAIARMQR